MERNLLIELLEDGEKVSLYSPHFEGEEYSEQHIKKTRICIGK
jgi:hypothetical protein